MKSVEFFPDADMRQFVHKFIFIDHEFSDLVFTVIPRNYLAIIFMGTESGEWTIVINSKQHHLQKETVYFAGLGFLPSSMKFKGKLKFWIGMLQPHVCGQLFNNSPSLFVNNIFEVDKINREIHNINEKLWTFPNENEAYEHLISFF